MPVSFLSIFRSLKKESEVFMFTWSNFHSIERVGELSLKNQKSLPLVLCMFNIVCSFFVQFAKTLISQGHLCPLPLHVCPVYWPYDNGLRLYPLPDLVVCADKFDPFHTTAADCTVMNPVCTVIRAAFYRRTYDLRPK